MGNKQHTNKYEQPIRNIKAFLTSYFKSNSGQRALTRQPSFDEHTVRDKKGEYTYRDNFKGNQIALALHSAVNKAG